MIRSLSKGAAVAGLFFATLSQVVSAATITNPNSFSLPGFSTGSLSVFPATSVNNDNASGGNPNVISYNIFFNASGVGPADLEFNLANSGGTTEYRVSPFGIGVLNNTGFLISGFVAQLGFGVGSDFVPSGAGDGLDFDAPDVDPNPVSAAFPLLVSSDDTLRWSGAAVGLRQIGASFAVDVPDGLENVNPSGANRFTLRLIPVAVPEPSSAFLVLTGLAFSALRIRRKSAR